MLSKNKQKSSLNVYQKEKAKNDLNRSRSLPNYDKALAESPRDVLETGGALGVQDMASGALRADLGSVERGGGEVSPSKKPDTVHPQLRIKIPRMYSDSFSEDEDEDGNVSDSLTHQAVQPTKSLPYP